MAGQPEPQPASITRKCRPLTTGLRQFLPPQARIIPAIIQRHRLNGVKPKRALMTQNNFNLSHTLVPVGLEKQVRELAEAAMHLMIQINNHNAENEAHSGEAFLLTLCEAITTIFSDAAEPLPPGVNLENLLFLFSESGEKITTLRGYGDLHECDTSEVRRQGDTNMVLQIMGDESAGALSTIQKSVDAILDENSHNNYIASGLMTEPNRHARRFSAFMGEVITPPIRH